MTNTINLPRYQHHFRVEAFGGDLDTQLRMVLTALFQFMRVGTITEVREGPHTEEGRVMMEVILETTCPVHELSAEGRVEITITNARRVEPHWT